jgi:hypothetical protein
MSAKTSAVTTTANITTTTPQAIFSASPSPNPASIPAAQSPSDQNGYNSYDDYDSAIDDYYAIQDGAQPSNPESYIATAIDPSTPDIPPPRRIRTRPKNSSYDSDQLTFTDSYVGIASSTPPEPESDNDLNSIHMIENLSDSINNSDSNSSATAAAMMAQEMSAVQALKRLSIGASLALDPDLPNYSSGMYRSGSMSSISNNSYRTSKDSSGFDFSSSRPTRSISAPSVPSFSQARREMSQNSQRPEINSKQASQLLWVPAHVHPEIAPQQWKSFVQNKLAEIQASQESKSESSTTRSRSSSVSSVNSNRRYSRLSRQFDNQDSYTDGADVLEKRRSTDSSVQQAHDPTIQSLSHQLESLGELEGWSVDPAQLARSLSNSDSQSSEPHDVSSPTSPVNSQVPLANDSDSPILPSPTSTLRRSKVTRYNKSSIRRGKRDIIERNQNSESTKLARSLSNSTKKEESATETEHANNNTPVPSERSTQPHVVPPIITTIEESEPKRTFVPVEVSEPSKPPDTTTALDQSVSQTESTTPQQSQEAHQSSPLTPMNEVQEASSHTMQSIATDPNTPVSPNTADYPTDDESAGGKVKSRKGTWGWLFNNGNGDPNAANREAGEEVRKASLESNESAPSSPVQANHPDSSDAAEEQRNRKNSSGGISEKKERLTHFFSKKKSVANLKAQKEKSDDTDKLKPVSSAEKRSSSPHGRSRSPAPGRERNKSKGRYRSKSKNRNKSPDRKETEESESFSVAGSNPATISAGLVAYSPEAAAYYGAPYQIPAHQYSDKSLYMMNHRYPPHIERAIYRLSHLKLGNPKRPLIQQVLLSNFMYAYLNLINQGFIRQQQEALYRMQREQQKQLELQQKRIQKDPHYRMQQQQWQDLQKHRQQQKEQQEMDPALLYQQQQIQQQQLQQQQLQQQQHQQQHQQHQQQHQQHKQQHLQQHQHQHKQQHLQQHHHPQQQHHHHQEQQHMYHQQQQQQYYENQYQQYGDASSQYSEAGQYGSGEVYYR